MHHHEQRFVQRIDMRMLLAVERVINNDALILADRLAAE